MPYTHGTVAIPNCYELSHIAATKLIHGIVHHVVYYKNSNYVCGEHHSI